MWPRRPARMLLQPNVATARAVDAAAGAAPHCSNQPATGGKAAEISAPR